MGSSLNSLLDYTTLEIDEDRDSLVVPEEGPPPWESDITEIFPKPELAALQAQAEAPVEAELASDFSDEHEEPFLSTVETESPIEVERDIWVQLPPKRELTVNVQFEYQGRAQPTFFVDWVEDDD